MATTKKEIKKKKPTQRKWERSISNNKKAKLAKSNDNVDDFLPGTLTNTRKKKKKEQRTEEKERGKSDAVKRETLPPFLYKQLNSIQ
jgi:ribosomal protein S2